MRANLVTAFVLAICLAAVSACGGGEEELKLDEYLPRFDRIGDDAQTRAERLWSEGVGQDIEASRDYFDGLVDIFEQTLNDLKNLQPPAEARDAHDEFVVGLAEALALWDNFSDQLGDVESPSEMEALFAELRDDPALGAVTWRMYDACLELQAIADENGIDVDLGCGGGEEELPVTMMPPTQTFEAATDPCVETDDPELLLRCEQFSQRVYWLGQELAIPDADDLVFISSYIDDGDEPISPHTRLAIVYGQKSAPGYLPGEIYLFLWYRPTWEEFVAQFEGYDPSTVPAGGPINWWQHPCVEEEVYKGANGADIHLFRAHLDSLIYIPPMTADEIAQCLGRPVGALGAHVYFEDTVVQFEVQDHVAPGELATPVPVIPGTTPSTGRTPPPFPTLVLKAKHPYNDEAIVRHIAASLRPYEGD